jgi:uncharacterized lipoprotein YddW (UPF0748 family)
MRTLLLLTVALYTTGLAVFATHAACAHSLHEKEKRELRAVWLTTLSGLDWPRAALRGNIEAQKQTLRDILDDLQQRNFNAVFFQVRSRGNAMFRSSIEPWCSELTGTLGKDPGWDPLTFAIEETKRRGMELHAWFNVFRVWSSGMPATSTPLHIALAQPSWVKRHGPDLWADPGIPEVRAYTLSVMEELVRNYDIDGIHLDYCRYPDRDFDDHATWKRYGDGSSRDDWRRNNVNRLVKEAYQRLTTMRPTLIVGSAPIGIYQNLPTARGWEGRNAIFQDSRRWMKDGYHDYVAPQIYWGLTRHGSRIDFEALVRDWSNASEGRHSYIGIAAYKNDIRPHLVAHIDAVRREGGHGVVFFRYEHIRDDNFGDRFEEKRLPPALPWKDAVPPNPVRNLQRHHDGVSTLLSWDPPLPASDGDIAHRYAIMEYRDPSWHLVEVLASSQCTTRIEGDGGNVTVLAVDRARNTSEVADERPPPVVAKPAAPKRDVQQARISRSVHLGGTHILLGYELPRTMRVRLRLLSADGLDVALLHEGMLPAGIHIVGIEVDRMDAAATHYAFEAAEYRVVFPLRSGNR